MMKSSPTDRRPVIYFPLSIQQNQTNFSASQKKTNNNLGIGEYELKFSAKMLEH